MKTIAKAAGILALAASTLGAAERGHPAPRPCGGGEGCWPRTGKAFMTLAATDLGLTIADIVTSERVIQGQHGYETADTWATGRRPGIARMTAVQLGEAMVFEGLAWQLERHQHGRMARIVQAARIGIEAECVGHNIVVYNRK